MSSQVHLSSVILFVLCVLIHAEGSSLPLRLRHKRQSYQISNAGMARSIKTLEKSIGLIQNKLTRHEFREAQVADFSTKTLNALNSGQTQTKRAMQAVSSQLIKMEEKILSLEALVTTTDERQRHLLSELSKGIDRLLIKPPAFPDAPPLPPFLPSSGDDKELKKILRKISGLQSSVEKDFKSVNNEVKIVGESLTQHMEQLNSRNDILWKDWNTCTKEHIQDVSKVSKELIDTQNRFSSEVSKAKDLMNKRGDNDCNSISNEVVDRLNALDKAYQDQEKEFSTSIETTKKALEEQSENIRSLVKETRTQRDDTQNSFNGLIENLKNLQEVSSNGFSKVGKTLEEATKENSQKLKGGVNSIASVLKVQTSTIMNMLDDSVSQADNLQNRLTEEFSAMSKEIRSLKKVEQVMLSTADAVLDTKRSIEFGIQQVIIELSDIVKNSGQNINSTLSDQINNISFAILKNQTSALTNMTARMEQEISQVWRQIGIMYQQIQQSADILGILQATTARQMNASLDKVGNLDGTVGNINTKVADVEDNLNYLLGRLSLVVSEFSHMKTGVGAELDRLRDMAQEFSPQATEYDISVSKRAAELDKKGN